MNSLSRFFFRGWRTMILIVSLALTTYLLYFHRLGSLVPGYSVEEVRTYHASADWHTILHSPINAPYTLIVWSLTAVLHQGLLMPRLVSAGFGIVAALCFFIITRTWYSYRIAFLATILFATSSGLLHIARLGSPYVLQLSILAFIVALLWYQHARTRRLLLGYVITVLMAILCYVPGMIWFELFGLIAFRRGIIHQLRTLPKFHPFSWGLLFILVILPLLLAGVQHPHIFLAAAGLPSNLQALINTPKHLLDALASIGIHTDGNTVLWVGHAPLLSGIEIILGLIGLYAYIRHQRSIQGFFLIGSACISLVLVALGGNANFALLLPLLYLCIAKGLAYYLDQWLTVFPRNPIARSTGVMLIAAMLFFVVLYQTRAYFVAWPHAAATKRTFDHLHP